MPSPPTKSMVGVSEQVPLDKHVLGSKLAAQVGSWIDQELGGAGVVEHPGRVLVAVPVRVLQAQALHRGRGAVDGRRAHEPVAGEVSGRVSAGWRRRYQVMVGCVVEVVEPLGVTTHCGS